MPRRRPQPKGPAGTSDPDSVEQEYGAEYSSETLDILRGISKPEYLEESSSLDPISDLSEYIEHGLAIPPATYDALQEIGREKLQALDELENTPPDPKEQDIVRYRQALSQGTRPEDMTWLKLRAYHRAMNELQAADKQQGVSFAADDPAPDGQLEALAKERRVALMARALLARKAKQKQDAVQRILSLPEPSEESEWAPARSAPVLDRRAAEGVLQSLCEHQGDIRVLPAVLEQGPAAPAGDVAPEPAAADHVIVKSPPRTVYTQTYLEQQALKRKVQRQQRQRSVAFWLSFLTVSGAYVARTVRQNMLKGKKRGGKGKTTPPQPRASDAGSVRV